MSFDTEVYSPSNNVRIVTATALFDGHDASISIMRRMLMDTGAEVIHLGHNRSVKDVVDAAIDEDAQGIGISSYQGGHVEYFKYIIDLLKERDSSHIKVFGGGGGVIVQEEIDELEEYGVTKIYSPQDGTEMGLQGMINHMVENMDFPVTTSDEFDFDTLSPENPSSIARLITITEQVKAGKFGDYNNLLSKIKDKIGENNTPVIGITGTGGAGKSSLTDELILRIMRDLDDVRVGIISCDPSRRKTGGALLGDRIRMNAIDNDRIYMRSLAIRRSNSEVPEALPEAILAAKSAGFDIIIAETAGIGQGDSSIFDIVDISIYVMTSEFGAASQLEKIDMLDLADLIVINKMEKRGSDDAIRDVRKQVQRNRKAFDKSPDEMPVFGTIASKFNDDGVTALYYGLLDVINEKKGISFKSQYERPDTKISSSKTIIIPPDRVRYLAEIAKTVRDYHKETDKQSDALRKKWHLEESLDILDSNDLIAKLKEEVVKAEKAIDNETEELVDSWIDIAEKYSKDELVYQVRDKEIRIPLNSESLSHTKISKISLPQFKDPGEIYKFRRKENLPGFFPFTAGVFPLKRVDEDPTRMFAGQGDPFFTNNRFKMLSANFPSKRLSTAFDAVTLFGCDPDLRPDIYGKVGTSGVSVCTLDDVKVLYSGFDLCVPTTSVSMTINGPAPMMLAMFINTAIDQMIEKFEEENNRKPTPDEYLELRNCAMSSVRGTVQADILKEDQGQNSCIFSVEFALKMMGDIQEFFVENNVRNFYSVSISGYHIAEAGANPISQTAFTLANGFTYVEYYLSRGLDLDSFAPNLSFFFSCGMDPEYTVIGRVARRIWAVALRNMYKGSERSQKLKYHTQTSGRSLHSQEVQFNDIRTTIQALTAIYDNCNSLHTNAYDEAITTPSEESVRRALAIQLIINNEAGLAKNENMNQGSFIVEELTDLVEEAILKEFDSMTDRGGVLGSMETGYQRSKIQDESMHYEMLKHSGEYPLIGVNTFINENPDAAEEIAALELARATEDEKESQLKRLKEFHDKNSDTSDEALKKLQKAALNGENIFAELMETVRHCSLEQITNALYEVGGKFRRTM
ncbi:MAG: methylmalonyl-CoA mutase family protein [Deltaproteobacteria bacterium]|nr:methylmalonyl-CoA mutase family protein [Deltaproteobacteria bacterium]